MLVKDRLDRPWPQAKTVDPVEIERFTALADEWWNPAGKFRRIHEFNAVRRDVILEAIAAHFALGASDHANLNGLRVMDVGCGAGLLCEPLASQGAQVTGIDATARNIEIARHHAAESGLPVTYRHCLAEHIVAEGKTFDVVLNTEVIEHVADPALLMEDCSRLLAPGGLMIVATLSRTLRSFLVAIVGAEYILGWLPKGTHDWRRFLQPREIEARIEPHGLHAETVVGVSFNPLTRRWGRSKDSSVNYMLIASKQP